MPQRPGQQAHPGGGHPSGPDGGLLRHRQGAQQSASAPLATGLAARPLGPYRGDLDNASASLKAIIDGIVDAGILGVDRDIVSITIERSTSPAVILEFQPIAGSGLARF